jgi:hypothetical protein
VLVRLVRLGAVTGQVTDERGQPVRGALAFAMAKPPGWSFLKPFGAPASADGQGHYRLYDLPPGQYVIAVSYAAYGEVASSGVQLYPTKWSPRLFTVSGGEEYSGIDFTILPGPLCRVSGMIELPKPGLRFVVSLVAVDQPALAVATQQTGPDGAFSFGRIAPGSYDLLASGPVGGARSGLVAVLGLDPHFGRIHVEVTGDLEELSIPVRTSFSAPFVLRPATTQQPASACPSSATLTLSPLEAWGVRIGGTAEVSFVKESNIDGLAPGRYYAAINMPGDTCYGAADMVLDLNGATGSSPVAIPVAPAGSIQGQLRTGSARPLDLAVVLLASGSTAEAQFVRIAIPNAESRFAFDNLRPGRYRIAVQPAAGRSGTRLVPNLSEMFEIEVAGGAPTDVELPVAVVDDRTPDGEGGPP